jgi:hypothetical protein
MPDDHKTSTGVSLDTVYTQTYAELRSCRDHELMVATWFTAILLAMIGAIVASKYAAAGSPLGVALERCPSLKWFGALVPVLLGTFGAWSIADAMRNSGRLRKWLTDTLEPKLGQVVPDQSCCPFIRPGTLMCVVLPFLGIFTAILIIHKPSVIGG